MSASGTTQIYETIVADTDNSGRYEWIASYALRDNYDGFVIVISPAVQNDKHKAGLSGTFNFQSALGGNPTPLIVHSSAPDQRDQKIFYPNNVKPISWKSGGTQSPMFLSGVQVELRSTLNRDAVQLIGENVTSINQGSGQTTWKVPSALQLDGNSLNFQGHLTVWGLDSRTNKLVYGESASFAVDFADSIPLTVEIRSPASTSFLYHGQQFTISLAMLRENGKPLDSVTARPTMIDMAVYNRDNKHVMDIVKGLSIPSNAWINGNYELPWMVPDVFPAPTTELLSSAGQRVYRVGELKSNEGVDYRIVYTASYELVEPNRGRKAIDGASDFFSVRKSSNNNNNNKPGSSSNTRVYWLAVIMILLSLLV